VVLTGFLCFQVSISCLVNKCLLYLVANPKVLYVPSSADCPILYPLIHVNRCTLFVHDVVLTVPLWIWYPRTCTVYIQRASSSFISVCCAFALPLVDDLQCISTFSHLIFIPSPSPFLPRACSCTPSGIRIIHRASFVFICAILLPLGFRSSQHSFTPLSTTHPSLCALLT